MTSRLTDVKENSYVLRLISLILTLFLVSAALAQVQPSPETRERLNFRASVVLQKLHNEPAYLQSAHLEPTDEKETAEIVAEFTRLFLAYADQVDRAVLSRKEFFAKRDQLLEKTRAQLRNALSKRGWARLDAFIKDQVKHLRIVPTERPRGNQVLV
jgi:hypothetical protein